MDFSQATSNWKWLRAILGHKLEKKTCRKYRKQRKEIIGVAIALSLVGCLCLVFDLINLRNLQA